MQNDPDFLRRLEKALKATDTPSRKGPFMSYDDTLDCVTYFDDVYENQTNKWPKPYLQGLLKLNAKEHGVHFYPPEDAMVEFKRMKRQQLPAPANMALSLWDVTPTLLKVGIPISLALLFTAKCSGAFAEEPEQAKPNIAPIELNLDQ